MIGKGVNTNNLLANREANNKKSKFQKLKLQKHSALCNEVIK